MGENSKIEWTDHTFSPWWGCVKVSPGCENCYADRLSIRLGLQVWGVTHTRKTLGIEHCYKPLLWNKKAEVAGQRKRVFYGSMCDVFEARQKQ